MGKVGIPGVRRGRSYKSSVWGTRVSSMEIIVELNI